MKKNTAINYELFDEEENNASIMEIIEIDGTVDILRNGDYLVIQGNKILVN
jgi:hypothetical protein